MKLTSKHNSKIELLGIKVIKDFIKLFNYPKKLFRKVKYVIFDEEKDHSHSYYKEKLIVIGIKYDWNKNTIIEMFLHEIFHMFTQHFCKTNSNLCNVYLEFVKIKYKYRGYEFEKYHKNNNRKDYNVLNDFAEHLIVLFNVILFMTKTMHVNKKHFYNENEIYRKFILYLFGNFEEIKKDLSLFDLIYKN
jgi:hypothetical protein